MGIYQLESLSEARTLGYKLPANVKHKLGEGSTVLSYIIGDCSALDTFLMKQTGLLWVFPKYLNALFRGVGQVIFCNNPFSGFLILFALYWADLTVGLATTLAASTAIFTAFIFEQDESKINAGLTTYNAVLVGSVTSSLWEPSYGEPITLKLWGFIILAAALSVLVNVGLGNLLGSFKPTLPSFTLAFNIVTLLLFTCLMPRPMSSSDTAKSIENVPLTQIFQDDNLHWIGVVQGILLSMGQVYAINNLVGSIIMYLSCLFYSPIVLLMSLVGATVGSCFGIVFAVPPYDSVYNGVWGFNAILAAIAVGGFFFIPNRVSFGVALGDVALVVLIQQALTIAFTPLKLPFLTYPFVISSIIFLEVTSARDKLHRVSKFSFPEMHIYEYLQSKGMPESSSASSSSAKPSEKYDPSEVVTHLVPNIAQNAQRYHHTQPSAPPLGLMHPELDHKFYENPNRNQYQNSHNSLRQRTHQITQFHDNNVTPRYETTYDFSTPSYDSYHHQQLHAGHRSKDTNNIHPTNNYPDYLRHNFANRGVQSYPELDRSFSSSPYYANQQPQSLSYQEQWHRRT